MASSNTQDFKGPVYWRNSNRDNPVPGELWLPWIRLVVASSLAAWQECRAPREVQNRKGRLMKVADMTAMRMFPSGITTGIMGEPRPQVIEEREQEVIRGRHPEPHTDFEKRPPRFPWQNAGESAHLR